MVPTVVVASTVISLDSLNERVHPVVVLVIIENLTEADGGVFNTFVLKVNVPEPVPDGAGEIETPSMVPVKLQPCPVGTLVTVTV